MILCVEDEATLRADLVEELRDAGYEVSEAGDGAQGLAEILRLRPRLVFCDVTMPRLNGIDMFNRLRREHPDLASLRFVFLSALEEVSDQLADGTGADGFLTKPVDFDAILAMARMQIGAP